MYFLHKLIYEFNRILIKTPVGIFKEINDLILKFTWKTNLENKENFGTLVPPAFKNSNKASAVRTRKRSMQQMRNSEIDLCVSVQLILTKYQINSMRERKVSNR